MSLQERFGEVLKRHEELTELVAAHDQPGSEGYTAMLKELADLAPIVAAIEDLQKARGEAVSTFNNEGSTDDRKQAKLCVMTLSTSTTWPWSVPVSLIRSTRSSREVMMLEKIS